MLLVGNNKDVREFLADMKGNGETINEVCQKFHQNPILVSMVKDLYGVDVVTQHKNSMVSLLKILVN